ncbi:ketosteroid isomerase-like protein [Thermocatellispora tengchongensis]|uniref:Ketosteroid isomerase-like protein n=1 Tax=Thermocatellispora tengchongensis TaxID=1073253 RepID=A0A840PNU2_9ACTN|nr:nuclear transport factor 2 family protein [Thermocatellispora tengchongensis]MBB5140579.1 ketosteroid isomerase-like protein [Thermocatellispora tengchongensis]
MSDTVNPVIQRNLETVEAHFHNENPDDVDKAIALYTDDIVWEAPSRGQVYYNSAAVKEAYLDIFATVKITQLTLLRQVATETSVFTDHIGECEVIGDRMPNLPFPVGTKIRARLIHMFEMRDGKIAREIAYEIWREKGSAVDHDDIPADAVVVPL